MSALLDRVARRVGAPTGLILQRTYAGRCQREAGALSWYASDADGRGVLAGYVPLSELVRKPDLVAHRPHPKDGWFGMVVEPAPCDHCKREAVWDYDPYVAELYEDQDPSALLCDKCFNERKDDI